MSTLRTFNLQHPDSNNNNIQLAEGGGVSVTSGILTTTNVSSTSVTTTNLTSTNLTSTEVTATNGTFSGNLSVGGVLTYEDVSNVDSVGVLTARSGIRVGAGESVGSDGSLDFYGTFYGDGSNLEGIDSTQIQTGNTNVQTVDTGSDGHVKVTTEGTERLRITSSGSVGIGTDNPGVAGIDILVNSAAIRCREFGGSDARLVSGGSISYFGTYSNHDLQFLTNASNAARIDTAGRLLIGATTAPLSDANAPLQLVRSATGPKLIFARNDTSVGAGEELGVIRFYGNDSDGTYQNCAQIGVEADLDHGTNDKPTRISFHTTSDNASSPTERLRIDSGGKVNNFINDSTTYSASSTPHNGIQVWNQNDTTNTFAALRLTAGNSGPATVQINSIREASGASALAIQVESTNTPSEALRIDSSAKLLIGTTSSLSAGSGQYAKLQVGPSTYGSTTGAKISLQRGQAASSIGSGEELGQLVFSDNAGADYAWITARSDGTSASNDYPGRLEFSTTTDGLSTPAERMRIRHNGVYASDGLTLDGQVLINATTPSFNENLKIQGYASSSSGTNYAAVLRYTQNGYKPNNTGYGLWVDVDSFGDRTAIYAQTNSGWGDTNIAVHGKSGGGQYSQGIGVLAEIAHSDANGPGWQPALYAKGVSATNSTAGGAGCAVFHLVNSQPAANPMNKCIDEYNGSNTRQWFTFTRNGSQIGSISHTSSSTSYNTSSDYRLKENIVTLTGEDAETRLRQLPVHRFNFISEPGKTMDGFLAHEVSPYVPEAVTGEHNGMKTEPVYNEEGKMVLENDEPVMQTIPDYQEIDQAKLVPLLTAALQNAFTKIDSLQSRLDAAGL